MRIVPQPGARGNGALDGRGSRRGSVGWRFVRMDARAPGVRRRGRRGRLRGARREPSDLAPSARSARWPTVRRFPVDRAHIQSTASERPRNDGPIDHRSTGLCGLDHDDDVASLHLVAPVGRAERSRACLRTRNAARRERDDELGVRIRVRLLAAPLKCGLPGLPDGNRQTLAARRWRPLERDVRPSAEQRLGVRSFFEGRAVGGDGVIEGLVEVRHFLVRSVHLGVRLHLRLAGDRPRSPGKDRENDSEPHAAKRRTGPVDWASS